MKKESILTGALILTLTGFITRIIGFCYRIYMTKMIGSEGIGLYQLIMPVYLLAWTITSSGITTTVSALTAKKAALKKYDESIDILYCACMITGALSIITGGIVFFFSPFIATRFINDERAIYSLKIIALCFPFMSVGSSIRGFFYGMQNSSVPAISQITEQLVRVFTVIGIFSFFSPKGLSASCAVTAMGITMGETISFIFTLTAFKKLKKELISHKYVHRPLKHFSSIISSALPLSSGRILSSLLSTFENMLIPQKLVAYGYTETNALSVYGKLTGMAMPVIQFPTAILTSFSTALIPSISARTDVKNNKYVKTTIERGILFSSVAGFWAFTVFIFLPKQAAFLLYDQSSLGVFIIKLAPLCPLIYTQIALAGILNGLGKQKVIFTNNILSSVINLLFIEFLMKKIGINAFIAGMFTSLLSVCIISLFVIARSASVKTDIKNCIVKPIVCSILSGILIRLTSISESFEKIHIIINIMTISSAYLLLILICKAIDFKDIKSLSPRIKKQG
ncbi:MAG: polysaccharide biosynthesis protein [Firmicutes bacterium]|nr:polysaccharide biosynthesis protein [Bacillota bacterium]